MCISTLLRPAQTRSPAGLYTVLQPQPQPPWRRPSGYSIRGPLINWLKINAKHIQPRCVASHRKKTRSLSVFCFPQSNLLICHYYMVCNGSVIRVDRSNNRSSALPHYLTAIWGGDYVINPAGAASILDTAVFSISADNPEDKTLTNTFYLTFGTPLLPIPLPPTCLSALNSSIA
ncbi:hypothetical protein J6590_012947 [Homalodisca vitripennis]|nr:hypothetical protein J6590_012947 [Homalodisca vitripennis]